MVDDGHRDPNRPTEARRRASEEEARKRAEANRRYEDQRRTRLEQHAREDLEQSMAVDRLLRVFEVHDEQTKKLALEYLAKQLAKDDLRLQQADRSLSDRVRASVTAALEQQAIEQRKQKIERDHGTTLAKEFRDRGNVDGATIGPALGYFTTDAAKRGIESSQIAALPEAERQALLAAAEKKALDSRQRENLEPSATVESKHEATIRETVQQPNERPGSDSEHDLKTNFRETAREVTGRDGGPPPPPPPGRGPEGPEPPIHPGGAGKGLTLDHDQLRTNFDEAARGVTGRLRTSFHDAAREVTGREPASSRGPDGSKQPPPPSASAAARAKRHLSPEADAELVAASQALRQHAQGNRANYRHAPTAPAPTASPSRARDALLAQKSDAELAASVEALRQRMPGNREGDGHSPTLSAQRSSNQGRDALLAKKSDAELASSVEALHQRMPGNRESDGQSPTPSAQNAAERRNALLARKTDAELLAAREELLQRTSRPAEKNRHNHRDGSHRPQETPRDSGATESGKPLDRSAREAKEAERHDSSGGVTEAKDRAALRASLRENSGRERSERDIGGGNNPHSSGWSHGGSSRSR